MPEPREELGPKPGPRPGATRPLPATPPAPVSTEDTDTDTNTDDEDNEPFDPMPYHWPRGVSTGPRLGQTLAVAFCVLMMGVFIAALVVMARTHLY